MSVVLRRIILIGLGLAIVAVIVLAFLPEPVPVDVAEVTRGPMRVTVDEEGRTRIRERYVISAPLAGRLRRIVLDPGDGVVAQETVVAVIEPTDPQLLDARARAEAEARVRAAESAVRQAEARKEEAESNLTLVEDEFARVQKAHNRGAATERELAEARIIYNTTLHALRAAEFAQEIAVYEVQLARSALLVFTPDADLDDERTRFRIHAPIDGRVLRVFQESVAVVQPGTPLLEVGDPADLEIVIDVLSTDAVKVTPGMPVVIEHWGGERDLLATVRLVEPSAFTKISALGVEEQRVNVIADFVSGYEERPTLGDGFRVEGRIVLWEGGDIARVPTGALFRHGDQRVVFVVENGRAVRRAVEIGHRNGLVGEVVDGLEPGHRVIVHPSDRVDDGVKVEARAGLGGAG